MIAHTLEAHYYIINTNPEEHISLYKCHKTITQELITLAFSQLILHKSHSRKYSFDTRHSHQ
uniref:Uncharacterized protein n=1 Tax=Arundo donax TaxID=35708 RepID=A0A0A8XXC0_ARUDO